MRDVALTLFILATLPLILRKPFTGVLVWTWLGLMNPHRQCWSFATDLPFAEIVAITLLISLLNNKDEPKEIPWVPISIILAIFWAWMLFTTFFALNPVAAWEQFDKVWKIQLMVFVTMMMLTSRERLHALVWVIVISLGFYGVKGGIFTLSTGGGFHVMGPYGSFIGGNNEIGLALVMTVPMMRYIQLQAASFWLKWGMTAAIGLTLVAILGTQSRGGAIGLSVMTLYLILKSRRKFFLIVFLMIALPAAYYFMPQSWHDRMATIQHYESDNSAEGRINAWWTAFNVAVARPLVGGGFEMFRPWVFKEYAPDPNTFHDVHSIYFEALGEHGFVGLSLFLTLGLLAIGGARSIVRRTKRVPERYWMRDLASMVHVSLVGYAVTGAFLGLAYFDYYYVLLGVIVGMQRLLKQEASERAQEESPAPGELATDSAVAFGGTSFRRALPARRSPFDRLRSFYDRL